MPRKFSTFPNCTLPIDCCDADDHAQYNNSLRANDLQTFCLQNPQIMFMLLKLQSGKHHQFYPYKSYNLPSRSTGKLYLTSLYVLVRTGDSLMSNDLLTAPGDLSPKWNINFNTRASLSLPFFQPTIIDDPVGLVGFGDSSALYFALVTDPGAAPYSKLSTIKAKTYIHGWTANSGRLYVLDGIELSAWDIRDGQKRESLSLLAGTEAQKATDALADLQKTQQRAEWATLLELAEDDWVRVTAKQNAAPPFSAERDQLDTLAADCFRMLKSLREMTGSSGGSVAARQLVGELRKALADKRAEVAPWCFSAPVVRRHSFEEAQRGVFVVQGDGRLYAFDKALTAKNVKKRTDQNHAELRVALLEDMKSN